VNKAISLSRIVPLWK